MTMAQHEQIKNNVYHLPTMALYQQNNIINIIECEICNLSMSVTGRFCCGIGNCNTMEGCGVKAI